MAGKVYTDSEALYAVRSAITKFAENFQEAHNNFARYFEQMNYQVDDYLRIVESDIEICAEEKRDLERQIGECIERKAVAVREKNQRQNGRTDSFVCDICKTRMMLKIYGDVTSCKASTGCSGTMHRVFDDGEYNEYNTEIQQLDEKIYRLEERVAELEERIWRQTTLKCQTSDNYIKLQTHQQLIMGLLSFGSRENPETAIAFIDKALVILDDYQAVGFDTDEESVKKSGR